MEKLALMILIIYFYLKEDATIIFFSGFLLIRIAILKDTCECFS